MENAGKAVYQGTGDFIAFLNDESELEKQARMKLKKRNVSELLKSGRAGLKKTSLTLKPEIPEKEDKETFVSTVLNEKKFEPIIDSATRLGYKFLNPEKSELNVPSNLAFLQSKEGKRLVLEKSKDGNILIHTKENKENIHEVVRQATLDKVTNHFSKNEMNPKITLLTNGDIQIQAKETPNIQSEDLAEITTNIKEDGSLFIDIENVKGKRCDSIVNELAESVGGRIQQTQYKTSYFQTKNKVKKNIRV